MIQSRLLKLYKKGPASSLLLSIKYAPYSWYLWLASSSSVLMVCKHTILQLPSLSEPSLPCSAEHLEWKWPPIPILGPLSKPNILWEEPLEQHFELDVSLDSLWSPSLWWFLWLSSLSLKISLIEKIHQLNKIISNKCLRQ